MVEKLVCKTTKFLSKEKAPTINVLSREQKSEMENTINVKLALSLPRGYKVQWMAYNRTNHQFLTMRHGPP
jgi:hypothetical protein